MRAYLDPLDLERVSLLSQLSSKTSLPVDPGGETQVIVSGALWERVLRAAYLKGICIKLACRMQASRELTFNAVSGCHGGSVGSCLLLLVWRR